MCPISGLVQFLIIVVTLLLLCHFAVVRSLEIVFEPKNATVHMYDTIPITYRIYPDENFDTLKLYSENPNVAKIENRFLIRNQTGIFNLTGNFLGILALFQTVFN